MFSFIRYPLIFVADGAGGPRITAGSSKSARFGWPVHSGRSELKIRRVAGNNVVGCQI